MNAALARLRAKTDRELALLIRRELERSSALVARGHYTEAAGARDHAKAWLTVVNLSPAERARLEGLLESLEGAPAAACA